QNSGSLSTWKPTGISVKGRFRRSSEDRSGRSFGRANQPKEISEMLKLTETGRLGRSVVVAGLALAAGTFATAAFAGECPADAKKPNAREAVDMKPVGDRKSTRL